MSLPLFFNHTTALPTGFLTLEEDTSRHVAQVLRMKAGEQLQLTDGAGHLLTTEIVSEHKKSIQVKVLSATQQPAPQHRITIAISLIKNAGRFEWFLEKATEIGVTGIIPMICERTEKQHFRLDRMKNILMSAMLQSQQVWLPRMETPQKFREVIAQHPAQKKYIAHCLEGEKMNLPERADQPTDALILIGPEGDFTSEEISWALEHQYDPVSLGNNRLRTETAGIAAAVLLASG